LDAQALFEKFSLQQLQFQAVKSELEQKEFQLASVRAQLHTAEVGISSRQVTLCLPFYAVSGGSWYFSLV
jgi:hypothetical protein